MNRQELIEKLKRIDENAFFSGAAKQGNRCSVLIIGASALLLCDVSHKGATKDVDVLSVDKAVREIMFSDIDFNGQCGAFALCLPYQYEDRLVKVNLDTKDLDVYVPSLEDLAVMKLYRWEDPDKTDLTAPEFLSCINWNLLEHIVYSPDEAQASRISDPENDNELRNMRYNFEEYKSGWRK